MLALYHLFSEVNTTELTGVACTVRPGPKGGSRMSECEASGDVMRDARVADQHVS